jgi:hypothetical protein
MTGTQERLQTLLDDFNEYRARTEYVVRIRRGHPIAGLGKDKAFPSLQVMDEWCISRQIDSRRWLYWLFARTNFRFAPKLTALTPTEKREPLVLSKYRTLRDTPYFDHRIHRELAHKRLHEGATFDPNRDLSPMAEALKRRYLTAGEPGRCMDQMFVNAPYAHPTWGYHPKSLACIRCPLAQPCAAKLRAAVPAFDPVALRSGLITLEQAQIAEGRWNHGR